MAGMNGLTKQTQISRLAEIKREIDRLEDEAIGLRESLLKHMKDWESVQVDSFVVSKDVRETRVLKDNAFIAKEIGKVPFLSIAKVSLSKLEKLVGKNLDVYIFSHDDTLLSDFCG